MASVLSPVMLKDTSNANNANNANNGYVATGDRSKAANNGHSARC